MYLCNLPLVYLFMYENLQTMLCHSKSLQLACMYACCASIRVHMLLRMRVPYAYAPSASLRVRTYVEFSAYVLLTCATYAYVGIRACGAQYYPFSRYSAYSRDYTFIHAYPSRTARIGVTFSARELHVSACFSTYKEYLT